MSRQRAKQQVGVALFPFLAVLICTMGALIVLLVLLVQQARVDATAIAAAATGGPTDDAAARRLRERLEDAQWRQELLENSRSQKTEELAAARAKLAHLEEHAQRLAARAKELLEQAQAIDEGRTLKDEELAKARAEATRLKAEIEQRTKQLEKKQKDAQDGQEWYALIPYEGRSGTRRRPIYVECTEFGVIIQPEGMILRSEDFLGPLGPGNPLDMALRATREHIESTAGAAAGQPYPLLVVRPGGILAYGAARAAMKAWDDEFGYELISDDKQLDFGAPDPALSARLSKAIADARGRQAAMIAMMPRKFQNEEALRSPVASPAETTTRSSAVGSAPGRGIGQGGSGGVGGNGPYGASELPGRSGFGGAGSGGSVAGQPGFGGTGGAGGAASGQYGNGGSGIAGGGAALIGQGAASRGAIGGASGTAAGSAAGGMSGATASGEAFPYSALSGNGASGGANFGGASSGGSTSMAAAGASGAAGGSPALGAAGSAGAASSPGGALASGSSASGSSMSMGQSGSAMPSFTFGNSKSASSPGGSSGGSGSRSSSKSGGAKGSNWALTNAKPNHIGVARPIKVAVLPDRIVLVPERGEQRGPKIVAVAPELTQDDVEHVVTAVQKEVEGWGLAVADGYWKPVLQAEVAPEAERHFLNLQSALNGSGIDIIRR